MRNAATPLPSFLARSSDAAPQPTCVARSSSNIAMLSPAVIAVAMDGLIPSSPSASTVIALFARASASAFPETKPWLRSIGEAVGEACVRVRALSFL